MKRATHIYDVPEGEFVHHPTIPAFYPWVLLLAKWKSASHREYPNHVMLLLSDGRIEVFNLTFIIGHDVWIPE